MSVYFIFQLEVISVSWDCCLQEDKWWFVQRDNQWRFHNSSLCVYRMDAYRQLKPTQLLRCYGFNRGQRIAL